MNYEFKLQPLVYAFALALLPSAAQAMSIDWSGNYRFEYTDVSSAYLTDGSANVAAQNNTNDVGRKSYVLSHLNLSPKILPVDGFEIVSNFEIYPSIRYPGSQIGSEFGVGAVSSTTYPAGAITQSATAGSSIEVNQLYMNWNNEFGALAVGRMPIHFGLGISHNAGAGPFDHWLEVHDLVAYKALMGNLSGTIMGGRLSKTTANAYSVGQQGSEGMLNIDYTNTETESTFAIFHQIRNAGPAANDSYKFFGPLEGTQTAVGPPGNIGGLNTTLTSLYIARGWQDFKIRMEAGFASGSTGYIYTTYNGAGGNSTVNLSGYGIAFEFEIPRSSTRSMDYLLRTGIASGDNPGSQNFEGFMFNRNYDVAMLLFNHPLGQDNYDVLRTKPGRSRNQTFYNNWSNQYSADDEFLSNAVYISPKLSYAFNDKYEWSNTFTYAAVQVNPSPTYNSVPTDLGYELDSGLIYSPHPKVKWLTQLGLFSPGLVWQEGPANRDVTFVWGLETKMSISF